MKLAAVFALSLSAMASLAWATDASMNSPRDRAALKAEKSVFLASDGADAIERFHKRIKELNKPKKAIEKPYQELNA